MENLKIKPFSFNAKYRIFWKKKQDYQSLQLVYKCGNFVDVIVDEPVNNCYLE